MNVFTKTGFTIFSLAFFFFVSLNASAGVPVHCPESTDFSTKSFARLKLNLECQMEKAQAFLMPPPCILLQNTAFDSNLSQWTKSGTVSATNDSYSGSWAASITGFYAFISQSKTGVVAGNVYTLSAFGKIASAPWYAVVGLRFKNSSNDIINETTVNVTTANYTLQQISATAPSNAFYVEAYALKFGGGTLKVDEFCLETFTPAIGQCILLHNQGLENGLNNWSSTGGTVANTNNARSGTSAVEISGNGASVFQRVAIKSGSAYELTAWAKTAGSPNYAEISLTWKDANNNAINSIIQPVLPSVTEYTQFSLKGKAPANAVYVDIAGYKSGTSSRLLLIDDFCFSLTNTLGGNSFGLGCGCTDNLLPNGGYEESSAVSFPTTFEGKSTLAIANNNDTTVKPWKTASNSQYSFYVKDLPPTVNNPEGDYFIWLPENGDSWQSNIDFSNNLLLQDGQTYIMCLYAASWAGSLGSNGLPNGGTKPQIAGVLNLDINFQSGNQTVSAWSVPASETFTNLSWTRVSYTFTYSSLNPVSRFALVNSRAGTGMAVDAVTLSKVNCPAEQSCGPGGIAYDRWGSIAGSAVKDLATNLNYPNNYNETGMLPSFQGPVNYNDNYGTRVYGRLTAPQTGNYTFTVTSADASKLFLSTTNSYTAKRQIASVPGFTSVNEYTKYPEQVSSPVALTAGQKYYIELVHKAGTGSDHFQVYWQTPSNSSRVIIPGSVLSPICFPEICYNSRDDDFDNLTDCADGDCSGGMTGNYTLTNENCGNLGGSIDLNPTGTDTPLSFRWSDMVETAWWTFERTTEDVSGNANHDNGISGAFIYTSDAVQGRYSAYLDGNTYIRYSVDNGFMEKSFSRLSVSMWIKPDDLVGIKTLFDEGGSTNGSGLSIRLTNNVVMAGVRNGGTLFSDVTHTIPGDGNWHHIAAVFNNGNFTVYLDGASSPTIATSFTTIGNHGNNGGIGSALGGSVINSSGTRYKGKIDDVRYFYEKALSANQVADLAGKTGDRTNLTAGTYTVYITSASGCYVSENITIASTTNHNNGGVITGDENLCLGSYDPSLILSSSMPSGGGAGTTQLQWQNSMDGGSTWTNIAGATNSTYDPPVISTTTLYRRGGRLVPCTDWIYSNIVSKSFSSNYTDAGIITGNESACGAFDPAVISSTSPPAGGSNGTLEYKWQLSTDSIAWSDIAGATSPAYDPPSISQTTHYKRGARRFPCAAFIYTIPVTKTVVTNFTNPGILVGDESRCGSFDPDVISSVAEPTGGSGGVLQYQWQTSTNGGATWTDAPDGTAETFNPTTIIQTTRYRRGARRWPCAGFIYANEITKMVVINFTSGGIISGDQSNCGSYDPSLIISFTAPAGGIDGTITYRWQRSIDNGSNWTVISGAVSDTYDPGLISQTTLYRRQALRSPCTTWINSNSVSKIVKPSPPVSMSAFPSTTNGFICEWTNYTFEANDAGAGATYTWDFGIYATPQTAVGKGPHSVNFNVPNGNPYTTVSTQLTININGCNNSETKIFDVRPQIVVTDVSKSDPTNCNNPNGSISVSAIYPTGTNIEASIDGGTTWDTPSIQFNNLAAGVYQLKLRYEGDECEFVWGSVYLQEPALLSATIQLSTTQTCTGETFTVEAIPDQGGNPTYFWDFGAGATPVVANGQGPHTVSYSVSGIRTISLSLYENFCTGYVDTTITIVSTFTDGGSIDGDEDLCNNGSGSMMNSQASPSGGYGGTTEYQWEKRTDNGSGGWNAWQDISGATASSFTPGTISVSTQFRRKARRSPCIGWAYSNIVLKRISGMPAPVNDLYTSACPGLFFSANVSTNDGSLSNPVYSIVTLPANGTLDLDADGEFIYTPNSSFCGSDQFTYRICNNGTSCCAIATATVDMSDSNPPVLQNIPSNLIIHCDDAIPLPPIVNAWENCQNVTLAMDETSTQGADSCAVYSYNLTRIWTAVDYCGNSAADQQVIQIQDNTAPGIYRIYTLPNGKKMVAGVMPNVTHRWKTVRFPIQFAGVPVVFAQVVTKNDNAAVVTRMRNISASQFQIRLQEEEGADGQHLEESVAWMAILEGTNSTGLTYEIGKKLVSSAPVSASFGQPLSSPGFIGTIQTFNENNPASLRISSLVSTSATIFCQEEISLDPEMNHGYETVGYFAVSGTGNITNFSGEIIGETGKVNVNDNFLTVNLTHKYHNPVVILGGISNSDNAPATTRVQNVTSGSFAIQIDEWDYLDGSHSTESVTYMVVEGSIPFDQTLECSAIPSPPTIGVDLTGFDNCDASVALTVTESPFAFDCVSDTLFTRTFSVQDECGNVTSFTQRFILRDTTPPDFAVPADITVTCSVNKDNLGITGDVTNESDNCSTGLNAVYADNFGYLNGCSGYVLRVWTLSDYCGNSRVKIQRITVYNENDADGDGLADPFDLDDDNDGIPDVDEGPGDTDGDGIPDALDLDSDNDGIPDIIEAGFQDKNGDGVVDTFGQPDWDLDNDGLANIVDANPTNPSLAASDNFNPLDALHDMDGDGFPNYRDLDSDNDGIPDLIEAGGVDTNGDGIIDYPTPGNPQSMPDADGDGFYDAFDPDNDSTFGIDEPNDPLVKRNNNNFIGGLVSYAPDRDGDGKPDFLDRDSDNDGIPDLIEAGGVDTNGDGKIDNNEYLDANQNGFNDAYETLPLIYTDPDGTTLDGRPEDSNANGTAYNGPDADFDGIPNHRDFDSDNDGIKDIAEIGLGNLDANKDGKFDAPTDASGDGFHDPAVGNFFTDSDGATNNGRPEDNSDGNSSAWNTSATDGTFGSLNGEPDVDDDGDNIPNFLDTDSDNDLLPDSKEDKNGNGLMDAGETGYLDEDSDNDSIIDGIEDANLNGIFDLGLETNPLNADTDSDGLDDGVEDANRNGVVNPGESDPKDPCDPIANGSCIGIRIALKMKLYGALMDNANQDLMRDNLRAKNFLPAKEPYSAAYNFTHAGGGGGETVSPSVFTATGSNAIVDWVFVELRLGSASNQVVATRAALVQRDGDIVDTDGISTVQFPMAPSGNYHVAVRHRNHLGVTTQNPFYLSPTPISVDFTDPAVPLHGNHSMVDVNGKRAMWPGDLNEDRKVIYQGPSNDVLPLFFHVLMSNSNTMVLANFISEGYYNFDLNMDGVTIYQGPNNDRAKLLFQSILKSPENSNLLANFIVLEKLP